MSHTTQVDFVKKITNFYPKHFKKIRMLEVGSLNINGTIRDFFSECEYVGYDVGKGECVDKVYDGIHFDEPDNYFDTVGSCNCFEHNPHWVSNFRDMHRMLKPNGLIFISVPTTGNPVHGTKKIDPEASPLTLNLSWEYYKNLTEADFRENFDLDSMFSHYEFDTHDDPYDLYFFGFKK
jgi:SAM-dependent methyltransferase